MANKDILINNVGIFESQKEKLLKNFEELESDILNKGKYQGMCETLDFLNINPAQWDDIKKGKLKVKLSK